MTKARDLANLLDANGDVKSASLDNVPAVDLTNLSASNLTSGTIPDARITALDATKLTGSIADARVPASAVSQHAVSFDDNAIINDLSTLALREATRENLASYSTNSSFIDVFQDGSGVASNTNAPRNSGEYHGTVSVSADSGGTNRLYSNFSWGWSGSTWSGNSNPAYMIHNADSYNYSAQMTNNYLSGNYIWSFKVDDSSMQNAPLGTNNSANKQFQYCVCIGTGVSVVEGNSIYGNNNSDMFWIAFDKTTTSTSVQFINQRTVQSTQTLDLINDYPRIAFVRALSPNTLKVYGGTGDEPHINGTLLHTFTSHGSTASNKIIYSVGHQGVNLPNIKTATDILYKENITSFGGSVINATGNIIGNNITAPSSTNKVGGIITYQDNAGTNALNTDLILKLSADGGSNYSTATLTALPDLSTGIKMAKVNDLSVTAGTSIKYQLDFANQSTSKEARIRGVSLQY